MELTRQEEQAMNLDRFLSIVKKNTEIEKLTPTILNEFVEKIIIHALDKSTVKRMQQVEISYTHVGVIELPDTNETDSKRHSQNDYAARCDNTSLLGAAQNPHPLFSIQARLVPEPFVSER